VNAGSPLGALLVGLLLFSDHLGNPFFLPLIVCDGLPLSFFRGPSAAFGLLIFPFQDLSRDFFL